MFAFLMSVGIAGALVSLFALGFGFSYNGFDLGNTLIIAGTTGLGAGLILIGLGGAIRELHRLADALAPRVAGRGVRTAEPGEPQVSAPRGGVSPRIPYPPKPDVPKPDLLKPMVEPLAREPRPLETRLAGPADIGAVERPRPPDIFAAARQAGEPPMVEEPEVTLPPPMRPPVAPPAPAVRPAGEPAYEPKFGPADILARLGGGRAAAPAARVDAPPMRPPAVERPPAVRPPDAMPEPAVEHTPERAAEPEPELGNMFESVWPTGGKPARAAGPDAIARAPKSEPKPDSKFEPKAEPRFEPKRPRFEPPVLRSEPPPLRTEPPSPRPEPPTVPEPAGAEAAPAPRPPVEAKPVSILKSGVIDGMAYTLYTDGSIEAQLPQGTMHFASIEDLRLHLERHG